MFMCPSLMSYLSRVPDSGADTNSYFTIFGNIVGYRNVRFQNRQSWPVARPESQEEFERKRQLQELPKCGLERSPLFQYRTQCLDGGETEKDLEL
jgi:hypothetical protein